MDLTIPDHEQSFREEVRDFLARAMTPEIREAGRLTTSVFAPVKEAMDWQRILHEQGWAAPHWPREYGGTGWSVGQRTVFAEELVRAGAPPLIPMGLQMCGPCLIGYGTEEQKPTICRASCPARISGARAIRSPAPAPTWRR